MKYRFLSVTLTAAVLLLGSGLSTAGESKTDTQPTAAAQANASPKVTKKAPDVKHKPVVKAKLVDLNSAKKEELTKIPGIGSAEADKIIAARPLGSKAWLVSHNLITMATYHAVKDKVEVKLTQKDIDTIMAKAEKSKKKEVKK